MGNCLVIKMKSLVNDNTLPILRKVEYKSYLTTSADNQYIDLTDVFSKVAYSDLKLDVVAKATIQNNRIYMSSSNTYVYFRGASGNLVVASNNIQASVPYNTDDIFFGVNAKTQKEYINSSEVSIGSLSSSMIQEFYLFKAVGTDASTAGLLKVKSIKVAYASIDKPIAELVPAMVDGVPCLYDKVNDVCYYEKNGGALVVE